MPEFGANGAVISNAPVYASAETPKIKRVLLAIFLCGIAACISVAIISAAIIFVYWLIVSYVFSGLQEYVGVDAEGFGMGLAVAVLGGAFNWFFFYLTVPAAWIALGFSIGRFPRRRILHRGPYYRWGAIWGALLVAVVTTFFSGVFSAENTTGGESWMAASVGGFAGGASIGAAGGLVCAWLFLLIVRPAKQLEEADVEAFA